MNNRYLIIGNKTRYIMIASSLPSAIHYSKEELKYKCSGNTSVEKVIPL